MPIDCRALARVTSGDWGTSPPVIGGYEHDPDSCPASRLTRRRAEPRAAHSCSLARLRRGDDLALWRVHDGVVGRRFALTQSRRHRRGTRDRLAGIGLESRRWQLPGRDHTSCTDHLARGGDRLTRLARVVDDTATADTARADSVRT